MRIFFLPFCLDHQNPLEGAIYLFLFFILNSICKLHELCDEMAPAGQH